MITQALIQLAHNLDLCVVAEGVETAGQLRALREQRCDQIQGWLHSKAMSAEAFLGMLRQYDPASWMTGFAMRHSPDELFSHSKISSS
jgi:EAL domain-containing protein (putative c-di-GMP-specific phosphodiesterase class I)